MSYLNQRIKLNAKRYHHRFTVRIQLIKDKVKVKFEYILFTNKYMNTSYVMYVCHFYNSKLFSFKL